MDGRWYMAGRCLMRQALRTFRLDRVSEPELGDEVFERPAGFDVKEYLNEGMPFVQSAYAVEVWLELPLAEVNKRIPLHRVSMREEDGGTTLRCGRDTLDTFAAMLLSMGCRVEVRQPAQLRQVFARLARRAAEAAEGGRGSPPVLQS